MLLYGRQAVGSGIMASISTASGRDFAADML